MKRQDGEDQISSWEKYDKLRPDYEQYVNNLKIIEKKNKEEEKQITKELDKMDMDKERHDIKVKQNIDWESPK